MINIFWKLSLGEIVQTRLDLVQVSGAMENILSNGNAQSQHFTRVNTNNEIQAKKRKGMWQRSSYKDYSQS